MGSLILKRLMEKNIPIVVGDMGASVPCVSIIMIRESYLGRLISLMVPMLYKSELMPMLIFFDFVYM